MTPEELAAFVRKELGAERPPGFVGQTTVHVGLTGYSLGATVLHAGGAPTWCCLVGGVPMFEKKRDLEDVVAAVLDAESRRGPVTQLVAFDVAENRAFVAPGEKPLPLGAALDGYFVKM